MRDLHPPVGLLLDLVGGFLRARHRRVLHRRGGAELVAELRGIGRPVQDGGGADARCSRDHMPARQPVALHRRFLLTTFVKACRHGRGQVKLAGRVRPVELILPPWGWSHRGGDGGFTAGFKRLDDPRTGNAGRYDQLETLMIAPCAALSGGEDCTEMADVAGVQLGFCAASSTWSTAFRATTLQPAVRSARRRAIPRLRPAPHGAVLPRPAKVGCD